MNRTLPVSVTVTDVKTETGPFISLIAIIRFIRVAFHTVDPAPSAREL